MLDVAKCEICGKEYNFNKLRYIQVPIKYYGKKLWGQRRETDEEGRTYFKTTENVIMCDKCFEYFWKLNDRGFASIVRHGGTKIGTGRQPMVLDVTKNF